MDQRKLDQDMARIGKVLAANQKQLAEASAHVASLKDALKKIKSSTPRKQKPK